MTVKLLSFSIRKKLINLFSGLDVFLTYLITYKLFPQRLVPISMNVQDDLKRKVGTIIKSEYFKSSFNNTEEKIEVTRVST